MVENVSALANKRDQWLANLSGLGLPPPSNPLAALQGEQTPLRTMFLAMLGPCLHWAT